MSIVASSAIALAVMVTPVVLVWLLVGWSERKSEERRRAEETTKNCQVTNISDYRRKKP